MKLWKRLFTVLIAAALVVSVLPAAVYAGGTTESEADAEITAFSSDPTSTAMWRDVADCLISNNISDNNYTTWSSTMSSAIYQSGDNTLTRVEYSTDGIVIEEWSTAGVLISSQTISCELSRYGGFYSGENYNFLVFGQSNPNDDDSCEVIRVVKYSKDWERLGSCSVYGANTYIPFDAGSLRMTETGGNLYIYTCHEMYTSSDGLHHQANMTFVVSESAMSVQQSYYGIMNIAQAGYVSHSFNQFIETDGTYVYRVDHGDAYPRAVSITRCEAGGSITKVSYTYALSILGTTGANATGVSVGGFELSADSCIIAGNSVDQSDSSSYSASGQRNIFVTVTDKNLTATQLIWLTDYTSDDGITPRTPQLVKLSDDQFLVLWEEYDRSSGDTTTRIAAINADGEKTCEVDTTFRLSDCQPILTSGGMVCWYVTNGANAMLYTINPDQLEDYAIKELEDCTVSLSSTNYTYDGSSKTPSVTVADDGTLLTEGTQYTVTYSNNINAGTATVTVEGTGNYTGTVTTTFTISKAKQNLTAEISTDSITVGGTASITATAESGTITYSSGDTSVATVSSTGVVSGIAEGTAAIRVAVNETANYESAYVDIAVTVTASGSGDDGSAGSTGGSGDDSSDSGNDNGESGAGDTLMVRRGTRFYFSYTMESMKRGIADFTNTAGEETDQVLVGDWDGDGIDSICLHRGNICYFINDITTMEVSLTVSYGRVEDEVLVGDWNGDGKDSLAMRRKGNIYYFCNDIENPNDDTRRSTYGREDDEVLVGDWENSGYDSLAARRNGNVYYISLTPVTEPDGNVWRTTFGRASDEVLVGDWYGDGTDTLAMRRNGIVYYISNSISDPDTDIDRFTYGRESDEVYAGKWK
ncbi:MAG: Ig-like domain-containing protein [Lachnospiraceae bacterium]|nr:Ig-like domain-containing protein [Lachnospiraceae bacterium]